MSKNREEFIQMLVNIDDYLNGDKENDSRRVINQVKDGLHTCNELLVWITSVKSKYVIPRSVQFFSFCLIFLALAFGISLFMFDISTDFIVNFEWRFFAYANFSGSIPCESFNISDWIEISLIEIVKECGNTTTSPKDLLDCALEGQNMLVKIR